MKTYVVYGREKINNFIMIMKNAKVIIDFIIMMIIHISLSPSQLLEEEAIFF